MNPLVVIPARGGSKGLPRKNIRHLAGVPLIVYSIRCARAAGIEHVIVSTDDDEIADVARLHGAVVPFIRPAILASDTAPMMPVMAHALDASDAAFGVRHDVVVLLDPTSPGREPDDITRALAMLLNAPTASGVVAVSKPFFNPFWVGVVVEDGVLVPAFPREAKSVRRQDVPPFFRINGSLYVWRSEYVASGKHWSDSVMLPLEMPESRAFSIDDLEEFEALEAAVSSGKIKMPWMHP